MRFNRAVQSGIVTLACATALTLQSPLTSSASESEDPIYILYEFDDPHLEVYTRSLVDIFNTLRFLNRRKDVETYPEERVDIIFVSKRDAIKGHLFSEDVLKLIGPEYSASLSNTGPVSERCSIHEVLFSQERTIVAIQDPNAQALDIECVHLALALFLGLNVNDFEQLSEEDELGKIINLARD